MTVYCVQLIVRSIRTMSKMFRCCSQCIRAFIVYVRGYTCVTCNVTLETCLTSLFVTVLEYFPAHGRNFCFMLQSFLCLVLINVYFFRSNMCVLSLLWTTTAVMILVWRWLVVYSWLWLTVSGELWPTVYATFVTV